MCIDSDTMPMNSSDKAEHIVLHFEEIDELMRCGSEEEQDAITTHLNGGMDLQGVLAQHEAELSALREEFIQAHVDDAESICSLYMDFVECEKKLVGFEEEIIAFQRRLADSADDMVKMQQQTVSLVRSINNRRLGSGKLSEVYTVLQECETFCDAIVHKEVDERYLENITELEKKMAFFSSNKELERSAVDLETRPRLKYAAVRAGDKLQRYFSKKIMALAAAENLRSIVTQQEALIKTGQNVISFLKSYNKPVAEAIFHEYAKRMSEVYGHHIRALLHEFGEVCVVPASSIDTIIKVDDVHDVLCNRDANSPKGNHVTMDVQTLKFPVQSVPRRERSVSQHMRSYAGHMLKSDRSFMMRETTISEIITALTSLKIRNESLSLDSAVARQLENVGCWSWFFVHFMQMIIQLCITECHFIHCFFCYSSSSARDDFDETETLVRAVLLNTLDIAQGSIAEDLPLVTDRQSALAGLRILDIVKVFLCRLHSPVPVLLLSGIMELAKKNLLGTLHLVMTNDQKSTQLLSTLRLSAFQFPKHDKKMGLSKLLDDRSYAATLGPHVIVKRFSQIAGELELLNSACLDGSMVDGKDVLVYDSVASNILYKEVESVLEFIWMLTKRHKNPLAQCIFALNNYFYIQESWYQLSNMLISISGIKQLPFAAPPTHVSCIEKYLSDALMRFVDEDSKTGGVFAYLFDFVKAAEGELGSTFFTQDGGSSEQSLDSSSVALSEKSVMQAVSDFNQNWQAQLAETCNLLERVVNLTMVSTPAGGGGAAEVTQDKVALNSSKKLKELIFKNYMQAVLEANTKMQVLVTRLFGKNNDMRARLTSNATLLHEVEKML